MKVSIQAVLAASCMFAAGSAIGAPNSISVYGNGLSGLCSQYALAGDANDEALRTCTFAIENEAMTRENYSKTLVNRGIVYLRRNSYNNAIRDFDRAERQMPELAETYVNRAVLLMKQERYADALVQLDRGIALSPSEPEKAFYNRGLAREATGNIPGAYEDFTQAVALRPGWDLPEKELSRYNVSRRTN